MEVWLQYNLAYVVAFIFFGLLVIVCLIDAFVYPLLGDPKNKKDDT